MHSGFMQFAAFDRMRSTTRRSWLRVSCRCLSSPLAGEVIWRSDGHDHAFAASNVREGIIRIPDTGSWRKTHAPPSPRCGPSWKPPPSTHRHLGK
jgi:hypothetical protein